MTDSQFDSIPIIKLLNLSKRYSRKAGEVRALNDISLTIYEGEFVAIVGESGSGKSTLLQIIGGLDNPSSGRVEINQVDITQFKDDKLAKFRRKSIGYIFQFFYLQPFLTLRQNIELPLLFQPRRDSSMKKDHIEEIIKSLKLDERLDHLPKELSGGQVQRVAIARALVNNPKILLADEPTGNLDQGTAEIIIDIFNALRAKFKTTIVIVTHDQAIATRADRIIRIDKGYLV